MTATPPPEPLFDTTPAPPGVAPPDPAIYDAGPRAMRQRSVNFAARRVAEMMFVTGLDRAAAERHMRWRAAAIPAGLAARPLPDAGLAAALASARADGRVTVKTDAAERGVTVRWSDDDFGAPVIGRAIARAGYGTILLGEAAAPGFDPLPIARAPAASGRDWPLGDAVAPPAPNPALDGAADALFASAPGLYGVLAARADRVIFERYSGFGAPDRATPSWSMTKAITATLIGRVIHEGWLGSVHDPAPAPLWADPRAIQRRVTLDHLLRMRAGLAFPVLLADGTARLGFENSLVYQDAADAFAAAQRAIVATEPGAVFRYVNSGVNVLGAVLRARIEARGLPYPAALYALLADRIGMTSFQHSADIAGNMIASGAGFATLRDYAKLGVLYMNDGVWAGERLLPEGWVEYALTPTHTGTSYAACFRTNADGLFPMLPRSVAWASGASDQRIFILREAGLVVAVANETDHPLDLAALGRFVAASAA
ncbi:MAG: serine hydrolase [Rhodospirillales bacterium]|nr:serine hydrolase [Rhodospirillales bacterium]